jgi:hypothetical protein
MRLREERDQWEHVARAAYALEARQAKRREQLRQALERIVDAWLGDRDDELAARIADGRDLLGKEAGASEQDEARAHARSGRR